MMNRNKYLGTPKVYDRKAPSRDSRKIYIYCEGSRRESGYFKFFAGLSTNMNIIAIPSRDGKTDPEKLIASAISDFDGEAPKYHIDVGQNDVVWFVIDTDQWGDKIKSLRNFCVDRNLEGDVWFVAQSNPCFEIWLYYHFFDSKPDKKDMSAYSSLKNFVDAKIPGGFDSRTMPSKIGNAIQNAKSVYVERDSAPDIFSTEVYKLGEVIYPFVKDAL